MTDFADRQSQHSVTLDHVLGEYMRRCDAGEEVDMESLCKAYPDLADSLREYASGEELLRALSDVDGESQVDSDVSQAEETVRPAAVQRTGLLPNTELGRYRVVKLLGEGAMGAIYLAEDSSLERRVALKIPKFTAVEDAEFRERFTREARAAARLDHPNICRVYDAGEIEATPFISMEFIDGPPLSRFIGTGEFRHQRRIAEVICEIASGLAHAHAHGVVHRDLKPGNVIMRGDVGPCITDFGLARSVDSPDSRITQDGVILGTPAYMSPEQVEAAADGVGPAADIYALGVLFYELLTGRLPFQGSVASILGQILRDRPQPVSVYRPDVDSELADLCLQMMEKSPQKRPASMDEVVDRLRSWLRSNSSKANPAQAQPRPTLDRLKEMKAKIIDFVNRGQFAAAVAVLEKMQNIKNPEAAEYVDWAREKLPEVRKLPDQLKQNIPALLATAKDCTKRHDYARAAQLLQEIPPALRNDEVELLLHNAIELQDECDLLLADLQECVRAKQFDGIEENLNRFLQLRPGNKFARKLFEALQTYRKVPRKQRNYRFDDRGHLLPRNDGILWNKWLLLGLICFLIVCGLSVWGITIYLQDDRETLYVKVLDEELLHAGALTLTLDGKDYVIDGTDEKIRIRPGEFGYEVHRGDTVFVQPRRVTISQEGRNVLEIGTQPINPEDPPPPPAGPTLRFIRQLEGHSDMVRSVSFSRDSDRLVSGSNDKTVRLWDVATGQQLGEFHGHSNRVTDVCFTSDGSRVVSCSDDKTIRVWDVKSRAVVHVLRGHSNPVVNIDMAHDAQLLVSAGQDSVLRVWNLQTGELHRELRGHTSWPESAVITAEGTHVFSASYSGAKGELIKWNVDSGTIVWREDNPAEWPHLALSPNESHGLIASDVLLQFATDQPINLKAWPAAPSSFDGRLPAVESVAYFPGAEHSISINRVGVLNVWATSSGGVVHTFDASIPNSKPGRRKVAVSPNGSLVACGSLDGPILLFGVSIAR